MLRFKPFRDWSIRRKLTGLFIAMAGITAIAVSVAIGAFDLLGLEQSMDGTCPSWQTCSARTARPH